ncbi:hypothetical protein Scep_013172 [Stephania cephalantha]|uniref:Uncharacterized protein n=1 Tax=Stephania cephalantha TaxID=152367 RepID=A0AAP0P883_9MAGN
MGLPPLSRHEYEEVLRDTTDVIGEMSSEKMVYIQSKPEESVDCKEKMSSDDDDCEDSGEDDSKEGSKEEGDEFMGEDKAVRDPYDNATMICILKNKKVHEEIVITPIVLAATFSHFSYGQSKQEHQSNSGEGHTHKGLNQPGIMDKLTSLEDNVEEIKVVVQQTCSNLRAEHKADCSIVNEEVAKLVKQSMERWQENLIGNLALNYRQIETQLSRSRATHFRSWLEHQARGCTSEDAFRDASRAGNPHRGRGFPVTGMGMENLNGDGGRDGDKISYSRRYRYGDGEKYIRGDLRGNLHW